MIMFFEIEAARPLRVEDGRAVCADIQGGVERGAFLVPFGHSQRSLFVLRHRAWGTGGKRVPCGHLGQRPKATRSAPEGSVSPVGCCAQRKATRRRAGRKRVPCGHLGRRPKATWRREQIQGLRAVSAQNADICEGSETMSAPKGSVSPVGCCAQRKATRRRAGRKRVPCGHLGRRPKATWRREQIQGLRAASAQNADICEGSETRMIEQPGRPLHPIHSPCLPSLSQYSGKISSNLSPYLSGSPPAKVSRRA